MIPFPFRARSCFICVHHEFQDGVSICSLVNDQIDSETIEAAECETYQEDGNKS